MRQKKPVAFWSLLAHVEATHIGEHFSNALNLSTLGILFPFLLTSLLKTAQGSSPVAVITAAFIIQQPDGNYQRASSINRSVGAYDS
jgi:H+/gluconate symporter-like permease